MDNDLPDSQFNVLYINSVQRSGSTLLGMLLSRNKSITYLGEMRNINEYAKEDKDCFCGEKLNECAFWDHIEKDMDIDYGMLQTKTMPSSNLAVRFTHNFVKYRSIFNLPKVLETIIPFRSRVANEYGVVKNIIRVYEAAAKSHADEVLVDSSHRNTQARLLYELLRPGQVKFIYLVRDGRAVARSVSKRTGMSYRKAAIKWRKFNEVAKLMYRSLPAESVLRVRYEDLCTDTATELNKILSFASLSSGSQQTHSDYHFIGGSSTLRNQVMTVDSIKLDEKWREDVSKEDLDMFEKVAGKTNRSFGYK